MQDILSYITPWVMDHGLSIIVIIVAIFIAQVSLDVVITRVIQKLVVADKFSSRESERKREETLSRILIVTMRVVLWIVGVLMVLQEVGIEVGPMIAAAGIIGLAFGFGGQYLIKDLISGLFIILENQYRIGDAVCLGDTCGTVEDITMRMTTLRDLDGIVHHVPHGEITLVSNKSKQFSRVNLDIGVAYNADLEKVIGVINDVGAELAKDEEWGKDILEAPHFLRVEDFGDSAVVLKILGDTKPSRQFAVMGELRKRIKIAFDKAGIEIPFPQRVVYHVQEKE
ncbi:mechanosensitive ion channel family protein [Candidatus Kaiserbacteria bacterium]|nr:mechanosensitive ion channel family protein [Candidatus Kaiserbacteria bacterium]